MNFSRSILLIVVLILVSCSTNNNQITKKIAVYSPKVNLVVSTKESMLNGYRTNKTILPNISYPCYPEDLLTNEEKETLNMLIFETLNKIKISQNVDLISIEENMIKNTLLEDKAIYDQSFLGKLSLENARDSVTISNFNKFPYSEIHPDSLYYTFLYQSGFSAFKAMSPAGTKKYIGNIFNLNLEEINNYWNGSIDLKGLINKKSNDKFSFLLDYSSYNYVPEGYVELNKVEKWDYKEICDQLNVDGLLFLDFDFYVYPNQISLFSKHQKYSIMLKAKIKLVGKNKRIIYSNTIKARSIKKEFPLHKLPIQRNEIILAKRDGNITLSKVPYCGANSFSLENIYSDLYKGSIEAFLNKLIVELKN